MSRSPRSKSTLGVEHGVVDHFFCFTCDEYIWDCDHLIDEPLDVPRVPALEPSQLRSLAHGGQGRVLEIEFRVTTHYVLRWVAAAAPSK
jgi:hypothetical protein